MKELSSCSCLPNGDLAMEGSGHKPFAVLSYLAWVEVKARVTNVTVTRVPGEEDFFVLLQILTDVKDLA